MWNEPITDRRDTPRVELTGTAVIAFRGRAFRARISDLSAHSLRLHLDTTSSLHDLIGQTVMIDLRIDGSARTCLRMRGLVQRVHEAHMIVIALATAPLGFSDAIRVALGGTLDS